MKVNWLSHVVKTLLVVFGIGVIYVAVVSMPGAAKYFSSIFPEIAYAATPLLILSEGMLALLLLGTALIFQMLLLFDRNGVLTPVFIQKLCWLRILCVIALVLIVGVFAYLGVLGGPGPGVGIIMLGVIFSIGMLIAALTFFHNIVEEGMQFREDVEWTV